MDLATLWFWITAACFIIYFLLEGFDFGVDLLRPMLARNEKERKALISTISPFWDGNEVWVILAAGVIFATFPLWYGALLTGMYPVFTLILLSLLGRGVAFEFRAQVDSPRWRVFWDVTSFLGSLVPAFLWGVVMANLVRGLPIGEGGRYTGGLFTYFDGFAVIGGAATLLLFMLHGAIFLLLRLHHEDALYARARRHALLWGALATAVVLLFVYLGYVRTDLFHNFGVAEWLFPALAALNLAGIWLALTLRRDVPAFVTSSLTVVFSTLTVFLGLFPNVLPSTLGRQFNLTVQNSASQPYTLHLMVIVALIFLPLIIGYQAWNYYVFRQRVRVDGEVGRYTVAGGHDSSA
ncbi:cytochrome d ubiquinol oxidase subunit II [Deinococcus maricopensis]|uniref:Cytochrome d ubiquinol oxidase, subunit II n=1 Tax=Deinococcus maricopensis (strain DSM 21211 / LMG 22137 / NRRL B-23946 / LB-34) TaxID=709986 RepID=E8U7E1_DEIML|nr:cytochrome d ubiquinol oxidase subunit II [Deinococcus maricopensis]ADV66980.1 cytochrome d ubiquinol oxidase, subunit II [Deinococcus maricopensis DSM 21211]